MCSSEHMPHYHVAASLPRCLRSYSTAPALRLIAPNLTTRRRHYWLMRTNHTVEFARRMHEKFSKFEQGEMEIWEAFEALGDYVDSADPDVEFPNVEHGFQTAEGIRAAGYPDWMQLVGLVHDVGKMQFLWGDRSLGMEGTKTGHQWSLGGDTWVVGCAIPESVVFPEFNHLNPDMQDERYNTEHGICTQLLLRLRLTAGPRLCA